MSTDLRRETDELARYYAELTRRLAHVGVRDTAELLQMYEQVRRAADAVAHQELGWMTEQVGRLVDAFGRMDAQLKMLRRLKESLGPLPEPNSGER